MVYALSFLFLFSIGGLTGLFLGTLSVDVHLTDTYFVIAHFHYVMMGGTIIAFIGGVHHWWHKFTGKNYNEKIGVIAAIIVFIGFNVTFFTQFIFGSQGMPRRYWSYLEQYHTGHMISTYGSYILAVGLFLALFNLLASLRNKGVAPERWRGVSLEWETATPPIEHNFESIPIVTAGPYDFPEVRAARTGNGH